MYLYVLDLTSNVILFHGAFPNRHELRPLVATVRDAVTGKLVLPQVIEAAKSSPEGGFVEYYFDDPADDTDSADIPKVGYARQFTGEGRRPNGAVLTELHHRVGLLSDARPRESPRTRTRSSSPCCPRSCGP